MKSSNGRRRSPLDNASPGEEHDVAGEPPGPARGRACRHDNLDAFGAMRVMMSSTPSVAAGSRLAVGSSRKSTSGARASAPGESEPLLLAARQPDGAGRSGSAASPTCASS